MAFVFFLAVTCWRWRLWCPSVNSGDAFSQLKGIDVKYESTSDTRFVIWQYSVSPKCQKPTKVRMVLFWQIELKQVWNLGYTNDDIKQLRSGKSRTKLPVMQSNVNLFLNAPLSKNWVRGAGSPHVAKYLIYYLRRGFCEEKSFCRSPKR